MFSSSLKQEGIWKRRFCVYICSPPDNLEISLPEFSSNTNPLRPAIVAFENVSGEVQMENNWCTSMMKAPSLNFSREAWTEPKKCSQVWDINIRAWLRGFRDKIAKFSSFLCPSIAKRDLDTKKTTPNIEVWPESLGAMLEYWYIEHGLFMTNTAVSIPPRSQVLYSPCSLERKIGGGRKKDPGNEDGLHHSDTELTRKVAAGWNEDQFSDAQNSVTIKKNVLFVVNTPLLCTKNYRRNFIEKAARTRTASGSVSRDYPKDIRSILTKELFVTSVR